MYQDLLDQIIAFYNDHFPAELTTARDQFFKATGDVFDDDPFYKERTAHYLEWFLFYYPLEGEASVIDHYHRTERATLPEPDQTALDALRHATHGLFEVKRIKPKKNLLGLVNLLDGFKVDVTERRNLIGLEKGAIFEARLVAKEDDLFLMPGLLHHPVAVRKVLLKQTKWLRKQDQEPSETYLMALQKAWMKTQRYAHVDASKIYLEIDLEQALCQPAI